MTHRPHQLKGGDRYAVLIGCDEAPDSGLPRLRSPEAELAHLDELLADPAAAEAPTIKTVLTELVEELGLADTPVVIWSGHGVPFMPPDTRRIW